MLENVVAATGGVPQRTGNLEADYEKLRSFLDNLLKVLERNGDVIDRHIQDGG